MSEKESSLGDESSKPWAQLRLDLLFQDFTSSEIRILQLLEGLTPATNVKRFKKKFGSAINGIGLYFVCVSLASEEEQEEDNSDEEPVEMESQYTNFETKGTIRITDFWSNRKKSPTKPLQIIYPMGVAHINSENVETEMFHRHLDGSRKDIFLDRFFSLEGIFHNKFESNLSLNLLFLAHPDAKSLVDVLNEKYLFPGVKDDKNINWKNLETEQQALASKLQSDRESRKEDIVTQPKKATQAIVKLPLLNQELVLKNTSYQQVSFVGSGGFGQVYKYSSKGTRRERHVAVKKLPVSSDSFDVADSREIQIISNLRHHNIVEFMCHCALDGQIAVIMELCKGGDLQKLIDAERRLDTKEVAFLMTQVCTGLEYIHSKNIVHRDIKPHNILIQCSHDIDINSLASVKTLVLKITDFGLSKQLKKNATSGTMSVVGTLRFMAPELKDALGGDGHCSQKSDVYSLGLVAYDLSEKDLKQLKSGSQGKSLLQGFPTR